MGLPWWQRNFSLYGDPLAITAFNQAFKCSPAEGRYRCHHFLASTNRSASAESSYWGGLGWLVGRKVVPLEPSVTWTFWLNEPVG